MAFAKIFESFSSVINRCENIFRSLRTDTAVRDGMMLGLCSIAAMWVWLAARSYQTENFESVKHLIGAAEFYALATHKGLIHAYVNCSNVYPPLAYTAAGLLFYMFGVCTEGLAFLSLSPFIIVFCIALIKLARPLIGRIGSIAAAAAAMAVMQNTLYGWGYMLELPLQALVCLAWAYLAYEDIFSSRYKALVFGLICALALLCKWNAVALILPAWLGRMFMFLFVEHKDSGTEKPALSVLLSCISVSFVSCAVLAATWYLPNIESVLQNFYNNEHIGESLQQLWGISQFGFLRDLTGSKAVMILYGFFGVISILAGLVKKQRTWLILAFTVEAYIIFLDCLSTKDIRYIGDLRPIFWICAFLPFGLEKMLEDGLHVKICSWGHAVFRMMESAAGAAIIALCIMGMFSYFTRTGYMWRNLNSMIVINKASWGCPAGIFGPLKVQYLDRLLMRMMMLYHDKNTTFCYNMTWKDVRNSPMVYWYVDRMLGRRYKEAEASSAKVSIDSSITIINKKIDFRQTVVRYRILESMRPCPQDYFCGFNLADNSMLRFETYSIR